MISGMHPHLEPSSNRFYHGARLTRNRVTPFPGPEGRSAPATHSALLPTLQPTLKPTLGQPGHAKAQPR